jgi:DNA-binding LytR/AlgR family response regulator
VAYLLKPFTIKETEKSLILLDAFIYKTHGMSSLIRSQSEQGYQQRFLVKKGNTYHSLDTGEIAYFFKDEVLFLVGNSGSKYIFDATLEEIESKLDPNIFFRVNRHFILSFDAIETLTPASSNRLKVSLKPSFNKHIIVSQGKVSALKKWLAS